MWGRFIHWCPSVRSSIGALNTLLDHKTTAKWRNTVIVYNWFFTTSNYYTICWALIISVLHILLPPKYVESTSHLLVKLYNLKNEQHDKLYLTIECSQQLSHFNCKLGIVVCYRGALCYCGSSAIWDRGFVSEDSIGGFLLCPMAVGLWDSRGFNPILCAI